MTKTLRHGITTEAEPLIRTLHWFPAPQRVTFKMLRYVFKAFNEHGPLYITELLSYYTPARPLRSSTDPSRLVVPNFHSVAGERRFADAAAKAWNCVPECFQEIIENTLILTSFCCCCLIVL